MTTLPELLNNPEEHYPGNFDTPERAVALLTGLCQDAAIEITRLQKLEPLTDDELADLWFKQSLDWMEFARAIEAKLKEKK